MAVRVGQGKLRQGMSLKVSPMRQEEQPNQEHILALESLSSLVLKPKDFTCSFSYRYSQNLSQECAKLVSTNSSPHYVLHIC